MDKVVESKGFIAALDQSGGSSKKTLEAYGISSDSYQTDEEMFSLMHDMRSRVIKSKCFSSEKILGAILFEDTIKRNIDGINTVGYLSTKGIISFLKIDKGLDDEKNGVRLMKGIPDLDRMLSFAKENNVFGTKMRSLINSFNEVGIKDVVTQQFLLAKKILSYGLVPIVEPEVSIDSVDKLKCEVYLKECLLKELDLLPDNCKVILKLTLPTTNDFYLELINHEKALKVVALSGGYNRNEALEKLKNNHMMIASFSRSLLEGLNVNDTDSMFEEKLSGIIDKIYEASNT